MRVAVAFILALVLGAASAHASIATSTFEVEASSWQIVSGSTELPYGLTALPHIQGSFSVDYEVGPEETLLMGAAALNVIVAFDLQVGDRTFGLSDLNSSSVSPFLVFIGGRVNAFSLGVPSAVSIYDNYSRLGDMFIQDQGNGIYCDRCVITNLSGIPEPSTWAMLLIGFAGVGFVTYRRRKNAIAVA